MLPIKKSIYQNNIVIIQYSMNNDLKFDYVCEQQSAPVVLNLIQNKDITHKLHTYEKYTCIDDMNLRVFEMNCPYTYLHYTFYMLSPHIITLTNESEYVVAVIENASGRCNSEQTKTSVVFAYKDGYTLSSNRCAAVLSAYSINIKHIKIYLWITDLVTVFSIDELAKWFLSFTEKQNNQNRNVTMLMTKYTGTSQYFPLGSNGIVIIQTSNRFFDIRLDKLAKDDFQNVYEIVLSGSGTDKRGSAFGVSVMIETASARAELLYFTTQVALTIKMSTHRRISLHVLNAIWIKLTYQNLWFRKYLAKTLGIHHSQYHLACKLGRNAELESIVCSKSVRLGKFERYFVGSYNLTKDEFYHTEQEMDITESYIGPVDISANEAVDACVSMGTQLLQTEIFGYWMDGLQHDSGFQLSHYEFLYWHINFTGHISKKEHLETNCNNINRLYVLLYSSFMVYNVSGAQSAHSTLRLSESILNINKGIFCSGSNVIEIPLEYCSVLVPNDYVFTYTLLYVPCSVALSHSGYVCEQRTVHQKHIEPELKTLLSDPWREFKSNETKFMKRHGYSRKRLTLSVTPMGVQTERYQFDSIKKEYPNLFECDDITLLPNHYVCDGRNDCPGGSDEVNCSDICSYHEILQKKCFTSCLRPDCECSDMYFQCESGGCIPSAKICDCFNDCSDGSDETAYLCTSTLCLISSMWNKTSRYYKPVDGKMKVYPCADVFDLCIEDHQAFPRNEYTASKFDAYFDRFCDDEDCGDGKDVLDVKCTTLIDNKCPSVHYTYQSFFKVLYYDQICDGKNDCAYGIDEWATNCPTHMFKAGIRCPRAKKIVHLRSLSETYDDKYCLANQQIVGLYSLIYGKCEHCPYLVDDGVVGCFHEPYIDLCTLIGSALLCIKPTNIPDIYMLRVLVIRGLNRQRFSTIPHFKFLLILKLINVSLLPSHSHTNNILTSVTTLTTISSLSMINCSIYHLNASVLSELVHLSVFHISYNPIHMLESGIFSPLTKLRQLILSHTHLTALPLGLFANNTELHTVDIRYTRVLVLNFMVFYGLASLEGLYISNIPFTVQSFHGLDNYRRLSSIRVAHVTHAELCCLFTNAICVSDQESKDMFATCSAIISHRALLVLAYLYALMNVLLNSACFAWNVKENKTKSNASPLLMINFNVADGLMSVYLLLTIVSHHIHLGNVLYVALRWKISAMCKVAGVIFMYSISMSNAITMLTAVDRFLCFVYRKFQSFGFTKQQCLAILIVSWVLGLTLPLLSAILSNITNSACVLIGGSVAIPFSIAYTIEYLLIFACTISMYASVTYTLYQSNKMKKSHTNLVPVMARLGAVALTNILTSMTVTTLSLLSVITYVPPSLEALLAFLLFPLNACLNPVINTVSTSVFVEQTQLLQVTASFKDMVLSQSVSKCRALVKHARAARPSWIS